MNKTIIININGTVFHIEEDAYEILKNYINDVKRHFMNSADSLEITTDIENRIAEMFNDILRAENKQVIVEQDVHTIITQMGTVEDFASESGEERTADQQQSYSYQAEARKLFRDSEDHLAGGVCAGIANYFGLEPVWIRLAFAIAFCFYGTGLLLYIVLWIVIPRAVTRADRMAMKGEPLDLQGFKRNFEYELKGIQGHAANLHREARPFIYKTRDFAGNFFDHLRVFLRSAGVILLKLIGILIMLFCAGCIITLLVMVFAFFAYGSDNIHIVFPFSIVNQEYTVPFIFGCFFLLALPLLGLLLLTSRVAFKRNAVGSRTGYTMLVIWIAALCVVIYYSIQVASEFKSDAKINQTISLKPTQGHVYHLKLNDVKYLSREDSAKLDIKHSFAGRMIMDDDYDNMDNGRERKISITIEKSDVPQPVLVESFRATGNNYNKALMNAHNIIYRFTQQDSLLIFDRHFQFAQRAQWRGQWISLTLRVPVGTELVIDKKLDRYMGDVDINECRDETMLEHSSSAPFMMTADGLQCYMVKPDSTAVKK